MRSFEGGVLGLDVHEREELCQATKDRRFRSEIAGFQGRMQ